MKVAAVVFIALQALVALALLALSVHGPSGLALAAPIYLAAGAALTWWASRKSWPLLVGAGSIALAAAPGVYLSLDLIEQNAYRDRVAATSVSEVRDELILSPGGRAIGVRLSYAVTVPASGYHGILPTLYGTGSSEGLSLQPGRWTFDGRTGPELGPFQAGKRHQLVVDLYPATLFVSHGGTGCVLAASRPLPEPGRAAPLRVEIYETPYGSSSRGGSEERTRGAYDLPTLYRNVTSDGWPPCRVEK